MTVPPKTAGDTGHPYRVAAACAVGAFLGGLAALGLFWAVVAAHLATFFGFGNGMGNSSHYLFWSGAGSDMAYLSVIGAMIVFYRKNNCRRAWCPFLGYYDFTDPADGVTRKLCWIHHPRVKRRTLKPSHIREIQERQHLFFGSKPGRG